MNKSDIGKLIHYERTKEKINLQKLASGRLFAYGASAVGMRRAAAGFLGAGTSDRTTGKVRQ